MNYPRYFKWKDSESGKGTIHARFDNETDSYDLVQGHDKVDSTRAKEIFNISYYEKNDDWKEVTEQEMIQILG